MIDASGRVLLIDFGGALMLGEGIQNSEVVITEPFPCEGKIEIGPDVWAIGQALLELIDMDESSNCIVLETFDILDRDIGKRITKSDFNESARGIQKKASDAFASMG